MTHLRPTDSSSKYIEIVTKFEYANLNFYLEHVWLQETTVIMKS